MNGFAWHDNQASTLLEEMPCGIVIIDNNWCIVNHNQAFEDVYGPSVGKPCYTVYKDRGTPCAECVARDTFADGKQRILEESGKDRHGQTIHYLAQLTPLNNDSGQVTHVAAITTDLTATKRLQREYQTLFEKVPCFVTVLNRDRRVVKANEMFRRTFGEPRGEYCYRLFKQRPTECDDCPAAKTFRDGQSHTSQHVGKACDGSPKHYVVSTAALVRGESDDITHVIEMCLDVTDMVKLEEEKLVAERLAAVGQTVAGLSHGIKNIMTGLEGGMYVTATGLKKGDHGRIERGWEMLERNMGRISELAKDLLSFSRGDQPKPQLIDPAQIVKDVTALYEELATQNDITMSIQIQANIESAFMDPGGMHDCLANLVSNACDACLLNHDGERKITIRLIEESTVIAFEVSDTGCGMDNDVKQRAFTSFFTTKGSGGTGLGLLTTRKIVQQHGGEISFNSTTGVGTTFRLSFPRKRLPKPAAAETTDTKGADNAST